MLTVSRCMCAASLLQFTPQLAFVQKMNVHHHKERHDLDLYIGIKRSSKSRANRHTQVNEGIFRKCRARKTAIIDLPEDSIDNKMENMLPADIRIMMLKKGINPYKEVQPRNWNEHQITFSSIPGVMEPSVKPENPLPFFSDESAAFESLKAKGEELVSRSLSSYRNYRYGTMRIRKKEGFEKFDPKTFGAIADTIFIEAHKALIARDIKLLQKYVTENAFQKMWPDVEKGSIFWELIEFKEPSRVMTIRCVDMPINSGNDIAQITVRMHSLQKLALYDRFGRIILGSENEIRPIVEYVVFENHIASLDGIWRLHDKVHPYWAKPKEPARITTVLNEINEESRPSQAVAIKNTVDPRKLYDKEERKDD